MKRNLTSIFGLVLMSLVTFQAYAGDVTQQSDGPPLVVPGGGVPTVNIPTTLIPGYIPGSVSPDPRTVAPSSYFCPRTITILIHVNGEKVEMQIINPFCYR